MVRWGWRVLARPRWKLLSLASVALIRLDDQFLLISFKKEGTILAGLFI